MVEAMDSRQTPETGTIVRMEQGRDTGQFAIVIQVIDERFVLVADGDKRKYDRPKRKNVHHLSPVSFSPEVRRSLEESGRVTNAKLRFAIAAFLNEQDELTKEGE
ncbi:hypothetical protein B0H94_11424 [Salsuginibacillus halophilus]|uniref:Ribosomal protein L14E/L6E/L27E n=1 Tax=Salsuginibacillus halophilus TaxID=517424 RepID=A0A2P8H8P0_9BACI|nr:KOW domain-containing RNA-binding protein [Salsuginibacillus halophilus]PSL42550.1 hypothetical protein B0H94_11424 [Salsuginibacillus halophilus]